MNPLSFLTQMIRIAIPYLFAASGGVVAERSGIVSLTLEGFMLTGAFSATLGAHYSGSPWIGVLCGVFGGLVFGLIHAIATIRYRADQVVVGVAINLLAIGVTRFFLKLFFASSSNSPRINGFDLSAGARGSTIRCCGWDFSWRRFLPSCCIARGFGLRVRPSASIPTPPRASAFPSPAFAMSRSRFPECWRGWAAFISRSISISSPIR